MNRVQKSYLEVEGKAIPVKVYHEIRRNVRASIGKRAVILRMPLQLSPVQQKEQLAWFANWVIDQFQKDKTLHLRFFGKKYADGENIAVGNRKYVLSISYSDHKTHQAKLRNGVISLRLSQADSDVHVQKSIKYLLSRVIGQDFKPQITRRVNELNQLYFQRNIKSVNLKYNQSNWGSCSAKLNVNLSTRLLFAPDEVIDYVIIHELAHLIELNHSPRFWKLVSDAMPDYKAKEKWLKQFGHQCHF